MLPGGYVDQGASRYAMLPNVYPSEFYPTSSVLLVSVIMDNDDISLVHTRHNGVLLSCVLIGLSQLT